MMGFPFMLFFALFFFSGLGRMFGFLVMIAIMVGAFYVMRGIFKTVFGATTTGAPLMTSQPYEQPYQPPQPYSAYQQPYESYDQGYQPVAMPYQPAEAQDKYDESAQPQYSEQPQAEYPQELPPMKQ